MKQVYAVAAITAGLFVVGCGGSSSSNTDANERTIDLEIPFRAVAGNQHIACGESLLSLGSTGVTATLADFRFYVHDIKMVTDEGVELSVALDADKPSQNADVALLDFRDTATLEGGAVEEICSGDDVNPRYNDKVYGVVTIPEGATITDIRFTLGVPFELNHANAEAAQEPLRSPGLATGMNWRWQNGYKFTGLDVLPVGGITRPGDSAWGNKPKWNVHLGSTGCETDINDLISGGSPAPCPNPNRPVITLPLNGFEIGKNAAIQLDYAALVADSNLSVDEGVAAGCMSGPVDPECKQILPKFGLPWGDITPGEQNVFSIVEIK